eukprot:364461-Chlamydomonas_euryale.AAC.3
MRAAAALAPWCRGGCMDACAAAGATTGSATHRSPPLPPSAFEPVEYLGSGELGAPRLTPLLPLHGASGDVTAESGSRRAAGALLPAVAAAAGIATAALNGSCCQL